MSEDVNVDDLAQEIRRVNGGNAMGAGALAEHLAAYLNRRPSLEPVPAPSGVECRVSGKDLWEAERIAGDLLTSKRDDGLVVRRLIDALTPLTQEPEPVAHGLLSEIAMLKDPDYLAEACLRGAPFERSSGEKSIPLYTTPIQAEPATGRAANREQIEALADKIWRVHPKDLDAAGYRSSKHGGKYEHPRQAWYADQIEALYIALQPVVPRGHDLLNSLQSLDKELVEHGYSATGTLRATLKSAIVSAQISGSYATQAMRDAVKEGETAALEYAGTGGGPIGVFLSGLKAYRTALAEAASPAPPVENVGEVDIDGLAAALWLAEVTDAGVPASAIAARTRGAFDGEADGTKDRWRKFARAALSTLTMKGEKT